MKKLLYLQLIVLLLIVLMLISGCTPELEQELKEKYEPEIKAMINQTVHEAISSINESKIVCNPPYIRHAEDCCLDVDNNSICDSDETPMPGGEDEGNVTLVVLPPQPTEVDEEPLQDSKVTLVVLPPERVPVE